MQNNLFSISNRKILVVGAGGGIGTPTALRLARAGAFPILMDFGAGEQSTANTLATIESEGGSGLCISCNILDQKSCEAALIQISKSGHAIDSMVFVAGFVETKSILTGQVSDLLNQVDLHVGSVMRLLQPLIPRWLEVGKGDCIVLTSIASELPAIDKHLYSASKAAATAFVQGLAASYGSRGLRFVPVLASRIGTPSAKERASQSDLHLKEMLSTQLSHRWITPEELAGAFHYLLTEEARPINGDPYYVADGAKSALSARPAPITS